MPQIKFYSTVFKSLRVGVQFSTPIRHKLYKKTEGEFIDGRYYNAVGLDDNAPARFDDNTAMLVPNYQQMSLFAEAA